MIPAAEFSPSSSGSLTLRAFLVVHRAQFFNIVYAYPKYRKARYLNSEQEKVYYFLWKNLHGNLRMLPHNCIVNSLVLTSAWCTLLWGI